MTKINHEEYEVLKELDDKWKWIARDKDREAFVYECEPYRIGTLWDIDDSRHDHDPLREDNLFQFIQWEDEEPYSIAELIEEYEDSKEYKDSLVIEYFMDKAKEGEETEVRKEEIINGLRTLRDELANNYKDNQRIGFIAGVNRALEFIHSTDEPEQHQITLQDVADKLWELPLNNRKLWLALLNDEFQEGYIVPLGLKTTDGEEQYLTYNGSYFASRRNKHLQQTFDTLEEIPEFYRDLAERVL